jgi:flagellar capping protein FliD
VIASYDLSNDAIILTNKSTGNIATFVTTDDLTTQGRPGRDDAGLVAALFGPTPDVGGDGTLFTPDDVNAGLDGTLGTADDISPYFANLTRVGPIARDAVFRINNGGEITSRTNVFDESVHGIAGLTVDASRQSALVATYDSLSNTYSNPSSVTEKVTVKGDPSAARDAVNTFITNYNALQAVIEKHTKVTYSDGKVTTGVLAGSREMADVSRTLRQELFRNIGYTGTVQRLSDMGVTSSGIENVISLSNSALLESKINTDASGVLDYFGNSTNGLITRLNKLLGDSSTDVSAASGKIGIQLTTIQKQNTSLDKQIAEFERRLESQRQLMESSFIAMERAQSKFQQQSSYLQRTFASNNK